MLPNSTKKTIIKGLTFFIFPKILRHQAQRRLRYYFKLHDLKPESLWERYKYHKVQDAFIKQYQEDNDIFAYRIISLGTDCFSRTIPTLWGVKPRKKQGEPGFPFDLSRHNLSVITNAISKDFEGYFDSLSFDKEFNCWTSAERKVVYCHEPDCHENDKKLIIDRFSERINNLRMILSQDTKPALFICRQGVPENLEETYMLYHQLYKSLEKWRQNRKFKLMIVDTSGTLEKDKLPDEVELLSGSWLKQPYVWHYDECRYSKQGLKFEQIFINKVIELLQQLMR